MPQCSSQHAVDDGVDDLTKGVVVWPWRGFEIWDNPFQNWGGVHFSKSFIPFELRIPKGTFVDFGSVVQLFFEQ